MLSQLTCRLKYCPGKADLALPPISINHCKHKQYCGASAMLAQTTRVAFPDKLSLHKGGMIFTQVIFEKKNGRVKMPRAQPSNVLM